ncbi:MAG: methylenetetrahydrofolate reductase [NAD(P)H] [Alphaproteobacteria bacterium GM202ARS2]|nr:methylenetetrahydrofolate reductase [NAD(P)H] [Alphaproteobacteria bacterium GM202ARS2]
MVSPSSSPHLVAPVRLPSRVRVSFEFFPPNNQAMTSQLWRSIRRLEPLAPDFVSVTYGAGGSTRSRTHDTVVRLLKDTTLMPAAHLTCIGESRDSLDAIAHHYHASGIRHIVALRGDATAQMQAPPKDGYPYAAELVQGLKKVADFDISVAAYPEKHPEAKNLDADIDNLKRKIDAGASRAITQFFFDNDVFLRFRDTVHKRGLRVPLIPGILPVTNCARMLAFSQKCGTSVPTWMRAMFEGLDHDPETRQLVAASIAAQQCHHLYQHGVRQFHFYTLNRADLTFAICHILGLRPTSTP